MRASDIHILSYLWCSSANVLHFSVLFSAISIVNRMYFIAPVFGLAQLRVSFAVAKGPPHNTRVFAFFVAGACDICNVVVSGPYLRPCRTLRWRVSLGFGPEAWVRQDTGG